MSPFWDWIGLERFEVLQGTDAKRFSVAGLENIEACGKKCGQLL